jgi:hypothetical protein
MAAEPGAGRDVDDRSAAGGKHLADLGLQAEPDAGEVDGDDAVPSLAGVAGDGAGLAVGAGVVDGAIESSEMVDGLSDGGLDLVFVGDVEVDEDGVAAGGLYRRDGGLAACGVYVSDGDAGAAGGEVVRGGAADAGGGASDEGNFAFEGVGHEGPFGCRLRRHFGASESRDQTLG